MEVEPSARPKFDTVLHFPAGTDTALQRIEGSELFLMGGGAEKATVMRAGELAVRIIKQKESPLAITVCMVADHQWPISRDTPVLKVGPKRFSFALPTFICGLSLPESCPDEDLKKLEEMLKKYCPFEDYFGKEDGAIFCMDKDKMETDSEASTTEIDFWTWATPKIEELSNERLEKIGAEKSAENTPADGDDTKNRAVKAIRMSAITKLVSKSLVTGAINFRDHVDFAGSKNGEDPEKLAYASVLTFSDVVRAVETVGQSIRNKTPFSRRILAGDVRVWKLNRFGLALLLRAVAAATAKKDAAITITIVACEEEKDVSIAEEEAGDQEGAGEEKKMVEEEEAVSGEKGSVAASDVAAESCLTGAKSVEKPMDLETCGNA